MSLKPFAPCAGWIPARSKRSALGASLLPSPRRFVLGGGLLALLAVTPATATELRPFDTGTLDELRQDYAGRPFLLLLWSVHCAPCFAELKMLGELLADDPALPFALVATDPAEAAGEVREVLEDYGLADFPSWQFAGDFPERLRFAIDPDWYGELPRSYFHDVDHQREGRSGALDRASVESWLESVGD